MALGSITSNSHLHHHPYQRQQMQHRTLSAYQQPRAIAPAPIGLQPAVSKTPSGEKFYGGTRGTTLDSNNPAVVRRNARERNRVKQVNNGFTHLRQHLPPAIVADLSNGRRGIGPGAHKKLSKVDTLRMALEYIRRLKRVIDEVDGKRVMAQAPVELSSWPNMATSATNSPPPTPPKKGMHAMVYADKVQQHFQTHSYEDTLQQQQQFINLKYQQPQLQLQQQYFNQYTALISPAGSVSSSASTSDCNNSDASTLYSQHHQHGSSQTALAAMQQFSLPMQMKYEQQYNEEAMGCSSGDEEDLLDYISLWQDEV
ncbi:PREDICTED: achaete-scute complex protein T5-like [Rhagoletis zephyria]|uniref:achaete-scute complex protein T5-like n=1 Tax=Rhagoletis zephyria TaxID=28612 RepID=UPI00081120F4|nr:PREDICTED: achaete-scute complex protein T5-like [Rhagoletis zephyria]